MIIADDEEIIRGNITPLCSFSPHFLEDLLSKYLTFNKIHGSTKLPSNNMNLYDGE